MPSSPQTVTTQIVFDYLVDTSGKAVKGAIVNCTLNFNGASDTSPIVNIGPVQQSITTDNNGYWQFNLIPNPALTPTGTAYTITTPFNSYDVSVPNSAGPFQSSSILVNAASVISPAVTGLTGPITVTGNETVTGNLTVNGTTSLAGTTTGALTTAAASIGGDLTIASAFRLLFGAAVSKLVPGATSFSVRDNADANDNLLVSNAGNVTARGSLTSTGGPITATAGDIIATAGRLVLNAAVAKIKGGATSLSLRNNADSADNALITDAGLVTLRNALSIPPSAGGTLAPTSYGTVPIKFDEQSPSSGTSITIPSSGSIPGGFRKIRINFVVRSGVAAAADTLNMRFNGDTGSNYTYEIMQASGASVSSSQPATTVAFAAFEVAGANSGSLTPASGWIEINNYAGTTFRRAYTATWYTNNGGTLKAWLSTGDWNNTANAITSVTFFLSTGPYVSGCIFTTELYP